MTTTAHEDQYLAAPEPVREPMSREVILRRNIADAEKEMQRQAERAESYAEALRSLASYVGAGGYNADTVDAGVFEEKIRWGIDEIQDRLAGAIERELVARTSLIEARNDIQSWIDSRNEWMNRAEAAEAELAKLAQQEPFTSVVFSDAGPDISCEFSAKQFDALPDGKYSLYLQPVPAPAHKCAGVPDRNCQYLAPCGSPCNKCGKVHNVMSIPVHAPAEIIELSKKYAIDTEAYHAAMDAMLVEDGE